MTLLDEDETALLRRARGAFDPAPEVAERVKAAVLAGAFGASLGAAGHATDVARSGLFSSWGFGHGLGSVVVKVVLGSVVALGVSAGAAALLFRTDTAHGPAPAEAVVTNVATALPKQDIPGAPEPKREERPIVVPSAEPNVASDARDLAPRASSHTPTASSLRREAPASSLASELAAIRAAEAAVNGGNPNQALAILDASGSSRPNLREEREALRALAQCARKGAARDELARRFVTAFPASLYAPRVRAACHE